MAPIEPIADSVRKLFDDPAYSDLVVRCGDRQWHVHKAIVCPRSNWFEKACRLPMKEAQEGIIEFKETEADIVGTMLYYLYTGDYEYPEKNTTIPRFVFHVLTHIAADQFDLQPLVTRSAFSFDLCVTPAFEPEAFAQAVDLVYNHDPDREGRMRKCLISCIALVPENVEQLCTSDEFAPIRKLLSEIPAFNIDLMTKITKRWELAVCESIYCEVCERTFAVRYAEPDREYFCVYCGAATYVEEMSDSESEE